MDKEVWYVLLQFNQYFFYFFCNVGYLCKFISLVIIFVVVECIYKRATTYLDAGHVLHSKEMVWRLIWCLHLQKLATWFLDELGLIHRGIWSWQIWLQGTKLCFIFNRVAGLGMTTFSQIIAYFYSIHSLHL